jgi:RND family efflux transporter MFP subunit
MSEQRHSELGIHPLDTGDGSGPGDLLKRGQVVKRTRLLAWILLVVLAAGAANTIVNRISNAKALRTEVQDRLAPYVTVALPKSSEADRVITLPGTLQGNVQAPISARASGYLKLWTKDIGSQVKKGDVLAELETPEIDQQLSQAIAAREQTKAAMDLANSTMSRWEKLKAKDVVSQQDLDEKRGNAAQAKANLAAAEANVMRLRQLEGFKRIVAPFDGIITKRNVDVGDLVDGGSGRPLFVLSQSDPLRVYLSVPQSYAQQVRAGEPVTITQQELGGREFAGKVARTSASIDTATRTMQVEVTLPNKDGILLPGAYVQVNLQLPPDASLVVPANALVFNREGTRLAVVNAQDRIEMRTVQVGRNLGQTVEIRDGLQATDRVVMNPTESLAQGDQVRVVTPAATPGALPGMPGGPAPLGPNSGAAAPLPPAAASATAAPAAPAPDARAPAGVSPPATVSASPRQ